MNKFVAALMAIAVSVLAQSSALAGNAITGTPTASGTFTGIVSATNGVAPDATQSFSIVTPAPPSVGAPVLLSVTVAGSGAVTSVPPGIACPGMCSFSYPAGTGVVITANPTGGSQFSGWLGACIGTGGCTATMNAAQAVSATFAPAGLAMTLDLDLSAPNTRYDALTDGLMILRNLFGLTGPSMIAGASNPAGLRTDATAIATYITNIRPLLDVDGNGQVDALTDGLLILRFLFGLTGTSLTNGAIGAGATRTDAAQIQAYILTLLPTLAPSDYWTFEDTGLVILNDNANTTRSIVGIVSLDLNGDGVMDSILVGPELENNFVIPPGGPPLSYFKRQSAHILLGGSATTSGASLFPSGRPGFVASGWPLSYDFNGDGKPDIFIADLGPDAAPNPGEQSVAWLSSPNGWAPATMRPAVTAMHGASIGRVAGQPAIFSNSICCAAEFVPFLYVFRNGTFEVDRSMLPDLVTDSVPNIVTPTLPFSASPKRHWTGSAIVDIDGDGIDDLVLGNFSAAHPEDPLIGSYVVFGTSSGWQSGAIVRLPDPEGGAITTMTILNVKAIDVDGDGKKDLVLGYTSYYNTRGIQILKNNGDRTFSDISAAMLGAGAYIGGSPGGSLHAVDLNGDGCVDLVEPESSIVNGTPELGRILLNDCGGHFVKANSALAGVLNQLPVGANILPFPDYTGRTSFYVPMSEPPSAESNGLYGTRYKKLRSLRNLPTPVNGTIVF